MALELKVKSKQNLKNLKVSIEDTSDLSPQYFSIVEFPEFLGEGKSLITLRGNKESLQDNTEIRVEILDQAGNPIYYEFPSIKRDDDTIIISVWVYTNRGDRYDTAPGVGEVIIVGTARGGRTVRWSRKIPINVGKLSSSKIVFNPSVVAVGSVSASVEVFQNIPQTDGEVTQIVSPNVQTKYIKSTWGDSITLEAAADEISPFNGEMLSGSVYIDLSSVTMFPRLTNQSPPTSFTTSVSEVLSSTVLRINSPITQSDSRTNGSIHTYEYSDGYVRSNVIYFSSASNTTTQNQVSFANVTISNVQTATGRIASVNTLLKSQGVGGDFEFIGNTKVTQDTTFTYKVAIPTEHLNDVKTLKIQFLNEQGGISDTELIIRDVVFPGGNVYIGGNQSIITGSVFVSNAIGSGLEIGGHSSGFMKSVGYDGITSASLGLGPGGFIIYSGSGNLQMGADVLSGVGMQFVGDNDDRHLVFTTANGGLLDVKTDKFFIGTTGSQFVSGSDGNIEISSSLFHLDPVNNLLVIGADAVINADLSANNIRTPATINGAPSTDLNASSSISSEGLARFVSASIGGWNVDTASIFSSNMEIHSAGRIQTKDYIPNLKGWVIDEIGRAEFENVKVRGTLSTTTFEKESVNAVGGQLYVANSTTLTGSGVTNTDTTMSVANASGYAVNEILQIKKVSDSGFTTEYVLVESASVDGDGSSMDSTSGKLYVERGYAAGLTAGNTFVGDTGSSAQSYEEGQVIVSTGKIGTGYIRMNANPNDQSTPYMDIVERTGSGVYDVELKARLGDLSGLAGTDYVFGRATPGFGLATDNVFLQGGIIATFGEIGGFGISDTTISSSNNELILKSNGQITGSAVKLSGDINAQVGTFENVSIIGQIVESSSVFLIETWFTSSSTRLSAYTNSEVGFNVGTSFKYGLLEWSASHDTASYSSPALDTTLLSASRYEHDMIGGDSDYGAKRPPVFRKWYELKGDYNEYTGTTTYGTVDNISFATPFNTDLYSITSEIITLPSDVASTASLAGIVIQTACRFAESFGGFYPDARLEVLDTSNNILANQLLRGINASQWLNFNLPVSSELVSYDGGGNLVVTNKIKIRLRWSGANTGGGGTLRHIRWGELRILKLANAPGLSVQNITFQQSALSTGIGATEHQGHFVPMRDNLFDLGSNTSDYVRRWDDVYATNGTIQTSDATQKENIVESDLGLTFVNSLRPVSYTWIGKTRTHYGLIAQEVSSSLSDVGKTTLDFAGITTGSMMGLRYSELISPMIKAIQELSDEVNQLKIELSQSRG